MQLTLLLLSLPLILASPAPLSPPTTPASGGHRASIASLARGNHHPTTCKITATTACRLCPCADCPVLFWLEKKVKAKFLCWLPGSSGQGQGGFWDLEESGCYVREEEVQEGCWREFNPCGVGGAGEGGEGSEG